MNSFKALVGNVSEQVGKLATGLFSKGEEQKSEHPKTEKKPTYKDVTMHGRTQRKDLTTYVSVGLNGYSLSEELFDRNEVIREERWREVRKPYVVTDNDGTSKAWVSRVWNLKHNEDVDDYIKNQEWEEVDRDECQIQKSYK